MTITLTAMINGKGSLLFPRSKLRFINNMQTSIYENLLNKKGDSMKLFIIILQILIIQIFFMLGSAVKLVIPLPIPDSMIGFILLFLALKFKIIKLNWVEKGGKLLLAELVLFFIPSAVGIINYQNVFSWQGLELLMIICISTMAVMATTAYIAEKLYKRSDSI